MLSHFFGGDVLIHNFFYHHNFMLNITKPNPIILPPLPSDVEKTPFRALLTLQSLSHPTLLSFTIARNYVLLFQLLLLLCLFLKWDDA